MRNRRVERYYNYTYIYIFFIKRYTTTVLKTDIVGDSRAAIVIVKITTATQLLLPVAIADVTMCIAVALFIRLNDIITGTYAVA